MVNGWLMEFFSVFSKFTYKWTTQTNLARLARPFRGRKHHFFPIIAVFQDFQTIQRLQNYLRGCPSISFNIATFLYIDSTTMSVWRPLFIKCIILDHKLQRMLNDSKIAQLNSERPLHQTAVCDKVINICLLILKCLLSLIYQIWVGLECKPNISTQLFNMITRPSVNHAKDWLGQLFLIPGPVWSGKEFHLWM